MTNPGRLIEIGDTSLLPGRRPATLSEVRSIDALFEDFITDVVLLPERAVVRVDSFPFLHSTLSQLYRLQSEPEFVLDIGEGLVVAGRKIDSSNEIYSVQITYGHTSELRLTTSQLLFMLCMIVADLNRSISATGIDAYQSLEAFPAALFF